LEFVLGEYIKEGVGGTDLIKLGGLVELKYCNTNDATEQLGGILLIQRLLLTFNSIFIRLNKLIKLRYHIN